MRGRPLPPDLQRAFGHLQELRYKGNGEWSSFCPECHNSGHSHNGPVDRFHIHASDNGRDNGRGVCRKCGVVVFANSKQNELPSPAKIQEIKEQQASIEILEAAQLQARLDEFISSKLWEFYHDELTDRERLLWEKAGIPRSFQDYWYLGYMKQYPSANFKSDALTIPYFDTGYHASNLQYRLLHPPIPNNKYRFTKGLKTGLWKAEPDRPMTGKCLLCEGMKKSAVAFIQVAAEAGNTDYNIISIPSAASYKLLGQLSTFDEVTVVLDPDQYVGTKNVLGHEASPPIVKVLDKIDAPVVKVARFPTKLDDYFNMYGGTYREFESVINQAYQYKPQKSYSV